VKSSQSHSAPEPSRKAPIICATFEASNMAERYDAQQNGRNGWKAATKL
jgi:hypothetical protein